MLAYWQYLIVQMIVQMVIFSVALVVFGVILILISRYYIYKTRLVEWLHFIANFLSICAALIVFAALLSALFESMFLISFYLFVLFIVINIVMKYFTSDSSSA